uniref:Uncharacterized protein n=1 Tax=Oryza barthii TaxID=65489 RepID=A0A0D3HKK4_9ORYZ
MASMTPAGRIRWSYTPSPSPSAPNLLLWRNWWQRWCRWLPRADPMEAMSALYPLPFLLRPQDSPVMAAVASMLLQADPMDVAAGGGIFDERIR